MSGKLVSFFAESEHYDLCEKEKAEIEANIQKVMSIVEPGHMSLILYVTTIPTGRLSERIVIVRGWAGDLYDVALDYNEDESLKGFVVYRMSSVSSEDIILDSYKQKT